MEGEDEGRDGRPFSTASTSLSLVSICVADTVRQPTIIQRCVSDSSVGTPLYLVVMGTEVLEVAKTDVGQTDHDGDDQHHQSEQRSWRLKSCWHNSR